MTTRINPSDMVRPSCEPWQLGGRSIVPLRGTFRPFGCGVMRSGRAPGFGVNFPSAAPSQPPPPMGGRLRDAVRPAPQLKEVGNYKTIDLGRLVLRSPRFHSACESASF